MHTFSEELANSHLKRLLRELSETEESQLALFNKDQRQTLRAFVDAQAERIFMSGYELGLSIGRESRQAKLRRGTISLQ